jgi:hypothetical protein
MFEKLFDVSKDNHVFRFDLVQTRSIQAYILLKVPNGPTFLNRSILMLCANVNCPLPLFLGFPCPEQSEPHQLAMDQSGNPTRR